jgi:hypothetical protein
VAFRSRPHIGSGGVERTHGRAALAGAGTPAQTKEAAQLRRPLSEFNLTNDGDVANGGPSCDHRDGPSRALG